MSPNNCLFLTQYEPEIDPILHKTSHPARIYGSKHPCPLLKYDRRSQVPKHFTGNRYRPPCDAQVLDSIGV